MRQLRFAIFFILTLSALPVAITAQDSQYKLTADSDAKAGVPEGEVIGPLLHQDRAYPGISREYWIYVPKQYDPAKSASLIVFLDGFQYLRDDYFVHARHVLDNLIASHAIPTMIAVFVNPGHPPGGQSPDAKSWETSNRATEYITTSARFGNFLADEFLPDVLKGYNVSPSSLDHCIVGASQGGAGAFIAAWSRPDYFSKVITHVGSFVNGPHIYPEQVLALEGEKVIRISIQENAYDNRHDESPTADWVTQNLRLYQALRTRHYDVQLVWGQGNHSLVYGGVVLPDQLRWIWRDAH